MKPIISQRKSKITSATSATSAKEYCRAFSNQEEEEEEETSRRWHEVQ